MADVTKYQPSAGGISAADFATAADQGFSQARPTAEGGSGVPYLKVDKDTGEWTMGQENVRAPDDALFGVLPQTFATGFVSWKAKKPEAKAMAVIGQPAIDPKALPPVTSSKGWEPNVAVLLIIVECKSRPELVDTFVLFESNSKGAIEAWNKLYDGVIARARAGSPDFAPVVALSNTSYLHKEWGTVFKPVFVFEDWAVPGDLLPKDATIPSMRLTHESDDAEGEAVKPARRQRPAEPEGEVVDAEVVEEQPRRRFRRNAE